MSVWVVGIAGPLLTVAGVVITVLARKRRERAATLLDQAQAAKIVQGMALDMVQPLKDQIKDLQARVGCLEGKVSRLRSQLRDAEAENARLRAS